MSTISKVIPYPGVQRISIETLESYTTAQALRDAQFAFDVQLHDLRSEFLQRESKLRQGFLDRVSAITSGE
jgi:hypothetical protein